MQESAGPTSQTTIDVARDACDLFLSYNSTDRDSVRTVRSLLELRQISTFFDQESLPPGLPWFDALEAALRRARAVAVFVGKDGLTGFHKREAQQALQRQISEESSNKQFKVIPVLLPGGDPKMLEGLLGGCQWLDLRKRIDDVAVIDSLARAVRDGVAPDPRVKSTICPYRALRAFREEDASLFFGREAFAQELLAKIKSQPLVTVVGRSGSGKSSVVQAGLLPLLRRQMSTDTNWEAIIFTPGARPFQKLAGALVTVWDPKMTIVERLRQTEQLGADLAGGRVSLSSAVDATLQKFSSNGRLFIVVDQFEELFTMTSESVRLPFVGALLEAANGAKASVVLTLRADFYGQAIGLSRELSDQIQRGLVNIGPMTRDELRSAIENPARRVGLEFEAGLVDRILDDVSGQPGSLPLLEFALTELWEGSRGGLVRHQHYDGIGGVAGAVSRRAEVIFASLSAAEQQAALRVFPRLVRVSAADEEGTDTRKRVRLSTLEETERKVVQVFVNARLLVTNGAKGTGEEAVEVAHETLIHRWERLQTILRTDRPFLLWRQRLDQRIDEWNSVERRLDMLLPRGLLIEARRFARGRDKDLSDAQRSFIRQSEKARTVEKTWKRLAAAAAGLIALAASIWLAWSRSDAFQIRRVLTRAPSLVLNVEDNVRRKWLRAEALFGKTHPAFELAGQVRDPEERIWALISVARVLVRADRTSVALAFARGLDPGSPARSEAVAATAEALAREGRMAEATNLVGEIKQEHLNRVTATIAGILVASNRVEEAFNVAQTLPPNSAERVAATCAWVRKLVRDDKTTQALAVAKSLPARLQQNAAMPAIAKALAEVGKIDDAIGMTNGFGISERSQVLRVAAKYLAENGKIDEALAMIDQHLDPSERTGPLLAIATHLAQKDGAARILSIALALPADSPSRAPALAETATALVKTARLGDARALVGRAAASEATAIRIAICRALLENGQLDLALETAWEIPPEAIERPMAVRAVAEALAQAQRDIDAIAAARKLAHGSQDSSALVAIAEIFIRQRQTSSAWAAIDQIKNADEQSLGHAAVLVAMMKAGMVDEVKGRVGLAREAALRVKTEQIRSKSLAMLATVFGQLHSYRLALDTADSCSGYSEKLNAYANILLAHLKQVDARLAPLIDDTRGTW